MIWPWTLRTLRRRRRHVSEDETRRARAELARRDPRVRELAKELGEAKRRNHFSLMVSDAIRRAREA